MTESPIDKKQIDRIEEKLDALSKSINGNGRIGIAGKVEIMWGYRSIFVGLFAVNIVSLFGFIVALLKNAF